MMNPPKLLQKAVILGNTSVGKSALIEQYGNEKFTNYDQPTIGIAWSTKKIDVNNCVITMKIWDTPGPNGFRSICKTLCRGSDCCILVFDVTDRNSLKDLGSWRDDFLNEVNPQNPRDFPFVVLGNKADLGNRNVTKEEAEQWCKIHNIPYFETSAKDGRNLKEAFETMAQKLLRRKPTIKSRRSLNNQKRLQYTGYSHTATEKN